MLSKFGVINLEDTMIVCFTSVKKEIQVKMQATGVKIQKKSILQNTSLNFWIHGAKMLDKCVKSQKKFFELCPFLQSQAK